MRPASLGGRAGRQPAVDPALAAVRRFRSIAATGQFAAFARRGRVGARRGRQRALARRHLEGERGAGGARRAPSSWRCRCLLTLVGAGRAAARRRAWSGAACSGSGVVGAAAVVLALVTAIPAVATSLDDLCPRCRHSGCSATPTASWDRRCSRWCPGSPARRPGCRSAHGRARGVARASRCWWWSRPSSACRSLAWGLRRRLPSGRLPARVVRRARPGAGGPDGGAALARGLPRVRLERPARPPWTRRHGSSPATCSIDDRLFLGGRTLASEDPLLRAVGPRARLRRTRRPALRRLGVRTCCVEKGNGPPAPTSGGRGAARRSRAAPWSTSGRSTPAATPRPAVLGGAVAIVAVDVLVLVVVARRRSSGRASQSVDTRRPPWYACAEHCRVCARCNGRET